MEQPRDAQADDERLTEQERATLSAGGRLVDDEDGDDDHDDGVPHIEGPNPR